MLEVTQQFNFQEQVVAVVAQVVAVVLVLVQQQVVEVLVLPLQLLEFQ
jgi:hypothetical protein